MAVVDVTGSGDPHSMARPNPGSYLGKWLSLTAVLLALSAGCQRKPADDEGAPGLSPADVTKEYDDQRETGPQELGNPQ